MINPYSLEHKRILVTGASSGIGKVAAITISNAGAKLIIAGRDEERLKETLAELQGDGHEMVLADYLGEDPVGTLTANIKTPVDGIVHSAGIGLIYPFKFTTEEITRRLLKVNFEVPYLITQRLFKNKMLANGCSILFISSIGGGLVAVPGNSIYGASKAALNGAVPSLAMELAPKKIRVNSLMPGIVKTKMVTGATNLSSDDYKKDELKYPLGYGMPEDVANTIVYFLSNAAKWVTGTAFVMDGGASIQ